MRIAEKPLTLAEYRALPETNLPTEVVDGQIVVTPSPAGPHQVIVARLLRLLAAVCPPDLEVIPGPADWVLWETPRLQVRQPDLLAVPADEALRVPLRRPPRLAVEIVGEGSFERDVVTKRGEYARAGAHHYWVVDARDPAALEVVAYRLEGDLLVEHARAAGDAELAVDEPLPARLRPADLVRRP